MDYGIANNVGKPKIEDIEKMLVSAINNGINSFDTAPTYGDSERVLGNFLSQQKINHDEIVITTKIPKILDTVSLEKNFIKMRKHILDSLKNLNQNVISICLLHEPIEVSNEDWMIKNLIRLKNEGLVKKIGISAYHPSEVEDFLNVSELDVIQIPINIFDNRLIVNGLLEELAKNNNLIFGRSIFLQGLITMDSKDTPNFLKIASPYIEEFEKLSEDFGLSKTEIAFSYVRDIQQIFSMVIGVDNTKQLSNNIELLDAPVLPENLRETILTKFANMPEKMINPSLWSENHF